MTIRVHVGPSLLVLLACVLAGCPRPADPAAEERVWTAAELKGLQGKTRDEIEEVLGKPTGLYTFDSKDRWHFPNVAIREEGSRTTTRRSVIVYFSKFGEHRATIIEVIDRWESDRE